MKLLLTSLVITSSLLFVSAATVIDSQPSTECLKTSGDIESYVCAFADTVLTYNDPQPAGVVNITLSSHSVGDGGGLASFGMLRCGAPYGGGPWGAGPGCSSGDVTTTIRGNGSNWGVIYGPSGGSVSPTLSAGTYTISLDADVYNGSYPTWCVTVFPDSCAVLDSGNNSGGTLTITNAASVNLNIGMLIDKLLNFFSL